MDRSIAAPVLMLLCGSCASFAPVVVQVENRTDHLISAMEIEYRGGSVGLGELAAGQTVRKEISVDGESGLALTFVQEGKQVKTDAGVYIEPPYCGTVTFLISDNVAIVDSLIAQSALFYKREKCLTVGQK